MKICKRYTIEHKLPLSRGGSNWPENIALACKSCNSAKCDKTVEEFARLRQLVGAIA